MRSSNTTAILCLCLAMLAIPAFGSDPELSAEARAVQEDVRKISSAVYKSDIDTTISFTHPGILELLGGEAKARETIAAAFAQFRTTGIKVESLDFPQAPDFVPGVTDDYVIVPTKTIMSANGQRVLSMNFQFGIRPKSGSKWTYMEGSRVTTEVLEALFPDFPVDYTFPAVSRERI